MSRTAESTLRRLITRTIVSEASEALPDGSPAESESDTASFLGVVADSITSHLLEISAPGDDALSRARRTITMRTGMSEFEAIVDGLSIVVGSNSENPLRSLFRSEQEMIKAVRATFDRIHVLSSMAEALKRLLIKEFRVVTKAHGEAIATKGEPSTRFYIVHRCHPATTPQSTPMLSFVCGAPVRAWRSRSSELGILEPPSVDSVASLSRPTRSGQRLHFLHTRKVAGACPT